MHVEIVLILSSSVWIPFVSLSGLISLRRSSGMMWNKSGNLLILFLRRKLVCLGISAINLSYIRVTGVQLVDLPYCCGRCWEVSPGSLSCICWHRTCAAELLSVRVCCVVAPLRVPTKFVYVAFNSFSFVYI